MLDFIVWLGSNIVLSFWRVAQAIAQPHLWLDWSNGESLGRFIYYGGSVGFFFVVLAALIIFTAIGMWRHSILWGAVRVLEGFANGIGRVAAWAGLLMVLQQIIIIFSQRIFASAQISIGFGTPFSADVSWWSEELKLYNAIVVTLCCAYTFVQKGHVRVDLIYAPVSYSTKKIIDMVGALVFVLPMATLIWMYAWFFMWRHLVTPKVSASDKLDLMLRKASILRWNVETIGFSPNGFNAYFLFKVLLVAFCGMIFLQGVAFFYRSYLEWREGPMSEDLYLDRDVSGGDDAAVGTH